MSMRPALRIVPLLLVAVVLAAGCSSGGGASKTPVASRAAGSTTPGAGGTPSGAPAQRAIGGKPASGSGSLIIATLFGMVEYSIKNGTQKSLIKPETDNTFILDPAISPDGKHLVYIVQPPPKIVDTCNPRTPTPIPVHAGSGFAGGCGLYDAGSDLWVANRDGSDPHVVYTHTQANQLVRFPQWQDNDTILVVAQEIGLENGVNTVSYNLERIPAAGGERTKVVKDVLAFGLSPDGARLAYARLAPQTGETLNAVDVAGTNELTLVGTDANLAPFNVPRYSPDGKKIAFSSADQTGARGPSPEYVTAAPLGDSGGPSLDGLPEDIWTIDVAGGKPVRVADLKEDLPALTWSGDGKHIYVVGSAGLYDVRVDTGAVDRLGEGAFHGQVVWVGS